MPEVNLHVTESPLVPVSAIAPRTHRSRFDCDRGRISGQGPYGRTSFASTLPLKASAYGASPRCWSPAAVRLPVRPSASEENRERSLWHKCLIALGGRSPHLHNGPFCGRRVAVLLGLTVGTALWLRSVHFFVPYRPKREGVLAREKTTPHLTRAQRRCVMAKDTMRRQQSASQVPPEPSMSLGATAPKPVLVPPRLTRLGTIPEVTTQFVGEFSP